MACSQSCYSRATGLQRLTFCLVMLVALPALAQPGGVDTGTEPERVLSAEPETQEGRFQAALLMVKLARPELAKQYLADLIKNEPTDQELMRLRDKFGTSTFLSLTNVDGLDPEASELLKMLTTAVANKTNDPAYASSLLPKLMGSARERDEALTELRALGPYAVPPMLQAIESGSISRDVLILNLTRLGDEAVPPIIGALTSPSEKIRTAAAEVLGWSGGEEDVIWLWQVAFGENQPSGVRETALMAIARIRYDDPRQAIRVNSYGVAAQLIESAIRYLAQRHEWGVRYEDLELIPVWTWDNDQATVVETKSTRNHASIHFAERLAREAAEISPTNEDAPIVLLAAKMVRDIEAAGWDRPVPAGPGTALDLAVTAGPEACRQVLALSLDNQIPAASLSAVTALGMNGSRTQLSRSAGKPEIIEALDSPNPRVQFAAAVTILQWEPTRSFPGDRRVVEILVRAINSNSKPDSVVIDPNIQRGTMTASLFSELGFDSSLAATGMDGFKIASQRGDVELAVLHPNTIRWGLTQTIENLRADSRTRHLPLVIYGPAGLRGEFSSIQNRFQNVVYVNEAVNSLEINRELRPVLQQLSPPPLTREQRANQVNEAAYWLRWIATSASPGVFELAAHQDDLIKATNNPAVADDAIIALGAIAAPDVQRRLLEIAESVAADTAVRQRALLQLAFNIQRFGVLLTPAELKRVSALRENSAEPELQSAVASVLGSLKPKTQAVRKLILDTPDSPKPISAEKPAT
ncbi:HEAT repeat domain-containing protein [Thalassoglobus sp.]|uniref:HEAT repeat domain-containing protein n=1 Tax=Thalassoglobus sp. TaxID=2795869 RepID=UPI003AA7F189